LSSYNIDKVAFCEEIKSNNNFKNPEKELEDIIKNQKSENRVLIVDF
jgi:hypothetical protein